MPIWLLVLIIVLVVAGMGIGAIVTKEQLERQQRILRMKRFRRDARARPQDLTREDKRTVV
jgi:hypothetical protein